MKALFLTLTFLLASQPVFSEVKFYVKANSTAYVGQNYKVSYIVENAKGKNFKYPTSFQGFQVLSGPNQSSNFSWVNGQTTQTIEYYFILRPTQEGEFTIPSASIQINNKTLNTENLSVEVVQGAQQQQQNQRNTYQQTQPNQQAQTQDWRDQAKDNIFIRVYVDKSNPYVGEQVTMYAKIYQRVQSGNTQIAEMPDFSGFWKHDYDVSNQQWQDEQYNGQYYKTVLMGKYALFPQRPGKFTISPFKLRTILRVQDNSNANDPWAAFFGRNYQDVEYEFSSNALNFEVKALPEKGKPLSFNGAVGNFTFNFEIDSTNLNVGSATTLKTKIAGTGNIMMANLPRIDFPQGLEVYDPQTKDNISKSGAKINGSKSADYLIIADNPGTFIIPPVEFSYFDLKSESYKTISSKEIKLQIEGDKVIKAEQYATNKENIEVLDSDIRYIALKNDLSKKTNAFIKTNAYKIAMAGAPLLFILLLFARKKVKELEPDAVFKKQKKAHKIANKRLKLAATFLDKQDKISFYNEAVKAIWDYLSDKFNIDKAQLNKDIIAEKLQQREVNEKTIEDLKDLLDKGEMALYSPIAATEMQADFEKAKSLILNIENEAK